MKAVIILAICLLTGSIAYSQSSNNKRQKEKESTEQVGHLKLYPTVADKYVNIYVSYDEPTDFRLTIEGTDRNNERKWELKAKMSYQQSLDVTALPEGEYTILLEGGGVSEKSKFNVKR